MLIAKKNFYVNLEAIFLALLYLRTLNNLRHPPPARNHLSEVREIASASSLASKVPNDIGLGIIIT